MTHGQGDHPASHAAPHLTKQGALLVAVSLAIFAMVLATQRAIPPVDTEANSFTPSFKMTGRLGEHIELRSGTLTLSRPRVARTLEEKTSQGTQTFDTPGIWLLVDWTFTGERKRDPLQGRLVTDGEVTFPASRRPESQRHLVGSDPGITWKGTLTFEVPETALAHATVTLGAFYPYDDAVWDTQAVVPLGIDDAQAARLVERAPASATIRGGR